MTQTEKVQRLIELLHEARVLMQDLESFVPTKMFCEYDGTPVTDMIIPAPYKMRCMNVCSAMNLYTVGDLMRFGSHEFAKCRNIGRDSVDAVRQCFRDQYKVDW